MIIRKVRLQNIRGFDDITLDLTTEDGKPRPWTTIIGMNGTGKTSLLRAVALGMSAETDASAMLAAPVGTFVTRGKKYGTIDLTVRMSQRGRKEIALRTIIEVGKEHETIRRTVVDETRDWPRAFVVGYGVARMRFGNSQHRQFRIYDSTRTLFDFDAELVSPELTIRRLSDYLGQERYDRAMNGIKRALDLSEETEISVGMGGGVFISGPTIGREIPLEGLADGYRLNLGWIFDLYGWALQAEALTEDGGMRGILLLDELEQHTHPSIQVAFVPRLKELWPELQVLGTTHSPLIVLGAEADEVVNLRCEDDRISIAPGAATLDGYSAEDILTDRRYFDTSPHRPAAAQAMSSYEQLAAIPKSKRSAAQNRRLRDAARTVSSAANPDADDSPLLREILALRRKYDL